jgi:hypothetical protein
MWAILIYNERARGDGDQKNQYECDSCAFRWLGRLYDWELFGRLSFPCCYLFGKRGFTCWGSTVGAVTCVFL